MNRRPRSKLATTVHRLARTADRPHSRILEGRISWQLLAERVAALEKRFDTVESRINGLILAIVGAVAIQVILACVQP